MKEYPEVYRFAVKLDKNTTIICQPNGVFKIFYKNTRNEQRWRYASEKEIILFKKYKKLYNL